MAKHRADVGTNNLTDGTDEDEEPMPDAEERKGNDGEYCGTRSAIWQIIARINRKTLISVWVIGSGGLYGMKSGTI